MDVFSLMLLAWYSTAGGISMELNPGWCVGKCVSPNASGFLSVEVELAMNNSSMLVDTKFENLHEFGMMYLSTIDECSYSGDGRLSMSALLLGALVAWNILNLKILAVVGGQESFVTVLNLIFNCQCFLLFETI